MSCRDLIVLLSPLPLALVGLVACQRQSPPAGLSSRAKANAPAQTFAQRWQSVPPDQQSRWLVRQLLAPRLDAQSSEGSWPHFESECQLELKLVPPPQRRRSRDREARPGDRIASPIDQISHNRLQWSQPPSGALQFQMRRFVEGGEQESYLRRGKKMWTRRNQEAWSARQVDDDLHLLWANEQRACVGQLLELAGPALRLQPVASAAPGQLDLELSIDPEPTPAMAPDPTHPRRGWRAHARVLSLSGRLSLDATHGDWRKAQIQLRIEANPPELRAFHADLQLKAHTHPQPSENLKWIEVHEAQALPQPARYHYEATKLLEGLAPRGGGGLGSLR